MPFTISQLAQATDVYVGTIRYYQRRGLVSEPPKPPRGVRQYGEEHVRRLRFIKHAQVLGFNLDDVADLLAINDGRPRQVAEQLVTAQLAVVRERIHGLRRVEDALAALAGESQDRETTVRCALIQVLAS